MAMTVGAVVGENLARLRENQRLTQYELVRALRARGIRWTRSKIAGLEAGKRATVDFGDVVLLAYLFSVPVWELLMGDGDVLFGGYGGSLPRMLVRQVTQGTYYVVDGFEVMEVDGGLANAAVPAGSAGTVTPDPAAREADEALARRLEVAPALVIAAAARLWGQTLTNERDQRTDALSADMTYVERQAHRGHITRTLAAEIEALLRGEDPSSVNEQGEEDAAGQ